LEPKTQSDTLSNLGPLRPLVGIWEGRKGIDEHAVADGSAQAEYVERIELQPIDPQTNGPQLFYGLRYHVHVVKPGDVETFHDQVGYWLWEPATKTLIQTLAIPRGLVLMAAGSAKPNATEFELAARLGSESFGICSNPFLQRAFRTTAYRIRVTVNVDGTWSYDQDTVLEVLGRSGPFHHRDRNTLSKIADPTPSLRSGASPLSFVSSGSARR
jgi:hypothetical protein